MHPSLHAQINPDKSAVIFHGHGEILTYGRLNDLSNQGAQLFRSLGLQAGDVIAICLENRPNFFEVAWAAQRSGLFYVCVSTKLNADETTHIVSDSGAKIFISSGALSATAAEIPQRLPHVKCFAIDRPIDGFEDFLAARSHMPAEPIADEQAGVDMLYSSGTTGRPKGIKPRWVPGTPIAQPVPLVHIAQEFYGASQDSIYLCPAPLYHAAPLRWCMALMMIGASIVIMDRFDAEEALRAIAHHRVSLGQFVPTHFVRMLKLPAPVRQGYDLSSLRAVFHAAAPCPIPVKEAMMDWWGPIIHEYYSGSEGNGATFISPQEWLTHKGSVGKPFGAQIHICDDDNQELPARTEGVVYFGGGAEFEYHNDPVKTAESRNRHGWTTLGDVGWVDEDGYLYLTDRKSFMIISGGVNVYPQEIENLFITHPAVADVAVIGAPDEDLGERVVAVIQPVDWNEAGPPLADELLLFARNQLSHVKVPRKIDFLPELPRHPTGKLYKRLIRDTYWAKGGQASG